MEFNSEVLTKLANEISKLGIFATQHQVNKFIADVAAQGNSSRDFSGSQKTGNGIAQLIADSAPKRAVVRFLRKPPKLTWNTCSAL